MSRKTPQKIYLKIINSFAMLTVICGLTNYSFSSNKRAFVRSSILSLYSFIVGVSFLILYPWSFLTLLSYDFKAENKGVTDYVRNSTFLANAVICSIIFFSTIPIFHPSRNVEIYNKGILLYDKICAIEG